MVTPAHASARAMTKSPHLDPTLGPALDALVAGGDAEAARPQVLARLKRARDEGTAAIEAMLAEDRSGRLATQRLSALADHIVRVVHDFALRHVFKAQNLSEGERMSVCAVGGYGRGMIAPRSDLDLLFLLPAKQTALGESLTEYILYMLWDLGFTVGHSTRSLAECMRQAKADMTVRTALLESRFLVGEAALHDRLVERYHEEVAAGTASEFIDAKLAERDQRHAKAGSSRYLVEPNVKEGKGGLRDLQTLYWIGKYVYRVRSVEELVKRGTFSRTELSRFRKAQSFLWAVRCHLHFETGREQDVLRFDLQPLVARRLGFVERTDKQVGLKPVERFMKRYFLTVREVGELTRIVCAELEEEDAKAAPVLDRIGLSLPGLGEVSLGSAKRAITHRTKPIGATRDFVERRGRIDVADDGVFARDPVNLVRIFEVAERESLLFHPDALHLVRRSLGLIDRTVRADPAAAEAFMAVLTSRRDPEGYLRKMNESGVLPRLVPEFGRVVAMMQFSMYHHYTVDEHLLRSIGAFHRLEAGEIAGEHPLAMRVLAEIDRRVLLVALFLHDIAKGRPEDHSIAGARVARKVCPRLGLTPGETETVAWLIEAHLVMSNTAQSRDLSDFRTIKDFAQTVQTIERLRLLLILTICDIRAVGPGVWNAWKGQLLRTLYLETEPHLTGGFTAQPLETRVRERREAMVEACVADGMTAAEAARVAGLLYPSYLLSVPVEGQVRQARFISQADARGEALAIAERTLAFEGITEIDVLAPDHPHLVSIIAGACAAADANIVSARIATTADGRALNTFDVTRAFDDDEDEMRRARRISALVREVLTGTKRVPQLVAERAEGAHRKQRRARAFPVETRVRIDNDLSNAFTVIEIEGQDRPGVLSRITDALSASNLNIGSAHIVTFGEKIVDTFYVTDLIGAKLTSDARIEALRARLTAVFEGEAKAAA